MLKQCEDTEQIMVVNNREDLANKERLYISLIKGYLPDLTTIKEKTKEVVKGTGATSVKDMKKVLEGKCHP
jgi:uncharacterized protein YqeY